MGAGVLVASPVGVAEAAAIGDSAIISSVAGVAVSLTVASVSSVADSVASGASDGAVVGVGGIVRVG